MSEPRTTPLALEPWTVQSARWPTSGKHILAQYDEDLIWVYQAYRPEIADWAVQHQRFGGPWSRGRMTWIKPNFLWMMYRSGWATKEGQERVLAIALPRRVFVDDILGGAVASSFGASGFDDRRAWQDAVRTSDVRLQWDPDHGPAGERLARRAIQLGLRGAATEAFADAWTRAIVDVTELVATQRAHVQTRDLLLTPREDVFEISDPAIAERIGLDSWHGDRAMRDSGLSFVPVDFDRHRDVCVRFRVDSYVVSFGDSELFGDLQRYLARIEERAASWPGSIVHVWQDGEIIGQLEMRRVPGDPRAGYINLFYLVEHRRGQGLGDPLHRYVERLFRKAGLTHASLSVSPSNTRALRYYARHGWVDEGPDPEKGERVHRMTRRL